MAKIRVYEIARDLNMKSKTLVEKLKDMNIAVGSHVSSLDDETINKIREIFGPKPDSPDDKGAKTTVIRRRRKPYHSGKAPATGEGGGRTPSDRPEKKAATPASETPSVQNADKETETAPENSAPVPTPVPGTERQPGARPASGERDSRRTSFPRNGERKHKPAPAGKKEERDRFRPGHSRDRSRKTEKPADASEQAKNRSFPQTADNAASQTVRSAKSERKRKKRKRDTPAKIIQLPPKPEEKPPEAAVKSVPKQSVTSPEAEFDSKMVKEDLSLKESKNTKKIRKKKPDTEAAAPRAVPAPSEKKVKDVTRWAKKKISFKRKEVVEGDDLYDGEQRNRKNRKGGRSKPVPKPQQSTQITTPKAIKRRVKIDDTIVLSDLAKRMGIKANEMIKKLMTLGVMATVNQTIDFDTAVLVASEFDYEVERARFEEETLLRPVRSHIAASEEDDSDTQHLKTRPPVVTIMGHVDHGKTSLLDVIRKTRITENEAGGITQHIGAYHVRTDRGQIVFLDTPGHEAFTAMRARGAKVTDLVVLVVAADDGVMPQTVEAINHSKAAGVPIIVAVNKIDKPGADTERVVRELAEHGLMTEDWGGDTIFVKVSAKQNIGIDTLLEMILLQTEVLELRADPDKPAVGHVVESKLDSGRGPVATVLIQEGTLHAGDAVVCGVHHGKIRALLNDRGVQVESAPPSIPVEVIGLSGVPNAGDEFIVVADDKSAKQVSTHRTQKQRSKDLAKTTRLSLEKLFERMKEGEIKDLNLIIKADVHGSIEALRDSLVKLSNEEVTINVIHAATGTITESDISLAAVSDAIIIGFNVRPTPKVQAMAAEEHVDMRFYNIIYNIIKDIQDAIVGMMASTYEERVLGRAEVREVFHVPKVGAVAGCYVSDGKIVRGKQVRLVRDGIICFDGKLSSLRRFKDDVKEVLGGYECGIGIENYNDIKVGDIIECYYMEEIKPELTS